MYKLGLPKFNQTRMYGSLQKYFILLVSKTKVIIMLALLFFKYPRFSQPSLKFTPMVPNLESSHAINMMWGTRVEISRQKLVSK